jgi:hypothetical protein
MTVARERHSGDGRGGVDHGGQFDPELGTGVHGHGKIEPAANGTQILHASWPLPIVQVCEDNVDGIHTNGWPKIVELVGVHIRRQGHANLLTHGPHPFQAPTPPPLTRHYGQRGLVRRRRTVMIQNVIQNRWYSVQNPVEY